MGGRTDIGVPALEALNEVESGGVDVGTGAGGDGGGGGSEEEGGGGGEVHVCGGGLVNSLVVCVVDGM